MKNLLLSLSFLITLFSFSQTGKRIKTLNSDGSISLRVVISDQSLSGYLCLYADLTSSDTLYFFQYKDLTYQYITSYQTSSYYTKEQIIKILDNMDIAKVGEIDRVLCEEFTFRRGFGGVDVFTSKGKSLANPNKLRKHLDLFLNN